MKYYYRILNIREKATDDELKRSYRMLAKRFHPDVSREENAAERFADVNEAYGVLSDPVKRAEYDRLLAKEYEARLSPEKIIAQRYPSRAVAKKSDPSRQEDDYLKRQTEYAARREAARREAETRATIIREAVNGGMDPSVIIAQQQVATIRAQAQEQARKFNVQLATAEKRAHEQGVEEGKRAIRADLNAVNGELKTVRIENSKLQAKLDGVLRDRHDLENELFNRDREFSEQKQLTAELEKQLESLKTKTVERTELTTANAELRNVNSELRTMRSENANLKRMIDSTEKTRAEIEKRLASNAELKLKADRLQKQVEKLESERSVANSASVKHRVLADELRAKIAKTQDQLITLERDNNDLTLGLRRMQEAYQKERTRADKERERAEKVAKAAKAAIAASKASSAQSGASEDLNEKIAQTQERLVTLERDNDELVESLRRAQEAYEKEHIRAEKERERAEKVAKAAMSANNASSAQKDVPEELQSHIVKTQERLITLERDNDELVESLRRAQEAFEKERERAEKEHARAEQERERAEKANKWAEQLDSEYRRSLGVADTKYDESINEMSAQLEEEQKKKSELAETLQRLNLELEKERERKRSGSGSEVEINKLTFSAEAGDLNAQNALGELYLYGKKENYQLALHWFKEAAKKKHADAMYNLGICYIIGAGVPKNNDTGMGFIRTAARLGSERARQYYYSMSDID